jgi:hypothetical protein
VTVEPAIFEKKHTRKHKRLNEHKRELRKSQ